jgi:hypothetical protein
MQSCPKEVCEDTALGVVFLSQGVALCRYIRPFPWKINPDAQADLS